MRTRQFVVPVMLAGAALVVAMRDGPGPKEERSYTADFGLEQTTMLLPNGETAMESLQPGTYKLFVGEDDGALVEREVTVLRKVRPVVFDAGGKSMLALARIVEEREFVDGELAEVSWNYYAACPRTGDIYNLGEDAFVYEDGDVVSNEGTWLAGKDGAEPGLFMPQSFLLGARYCRAIAPGVSMDRAEHIAMGVTIQTPAGTFANCVKIVETSPLEPDEEVINIYAPGVGLIVDDQLVLVEYRASPLGSNNSR